MTPEEEAYRAGHLAGTQYDGPMPADVVGWDYEKWQTKRLSSWYDTAKVGDPAREYGEDDLIPCTVDDPEVLLLCTRPAGHIGKQHVAEGMSTVLGVWGWDD